MPKGRNPLHWEKKGLERKKKKKKNQWNIANTKREKKRSGYVSYGVKPQKWRASKKKKKKKTLHRNGGATPLLRNEIAGM